MLKGLSAIQLHFGNPVCPCNGMGCVVQIAQLPTAAVALVDSGATHSFISAQLVSKHGLTVAPG